VWLAAGADDALCASERERRGASAAAVCGTGALVPTGPGHFAHAPCIVLTHPA